MARQLEAAGEEVALLVLLEAPAYLLTSHREGLDAASAGRTSWVRSHGGRTTANKGALAWARKRGWVAMAARADPRMWEFTGDYLGPLSLLAGFSARTRIDSRLMQVTKVRPSTASRGGCRP